MISPEYAYVLGACFDVPMLEDKYRTHVVANFGNFLSVSKTENYFNMLIKWCPQKIASLFEDCLAREVTPSSVHQNELTKEEENSWNDKVVQRCKSILSHVRKRQELIILSENCPIPKFFLSFIELRRVDCSWSLRRHLERSQRRLIKGYFNPDSRSWVDSKLIILRLIN